MKFGAKGFYLIDELARQLFAANGFYCWDIEYRFFRIELYALTAGMFEDINDAGFNAKEAKARTQRKGQRALLQ